MTREPVAQAEVRLITSQAEQRAALAWRHSRLRPETLRDLWLEVARRRERAGDHSGCERARRAARNAR